VRKILDTTSLVARRHDLNANMLFTWRRQARAVASVPAAEPVRFVPAAVTADPASTVSLAPSTVVGGMKIVLAGGDQVIVGMDVDAAALARVVKVLSRR
jgi:transposase